MLNGGGECVNACSATVGVGPEPFSIFHLSFLMISHFSLVAQENGSTGITRITRPNSERHFVWVGEIGSCDWAWMCFLRDQMKNEK